MKIVSLNGQPTFGEMKGSLELLPKTNPWVKMGDALPWAEYEKVYNQRLNNDSVGASNKPGRLVIGALIIKHKLNLSDEVTVLAIQENPYMQYMCGLTEYTDKPIFDPSLFDTIRKRITIEDINALTLELARKSRQAQEKKKDDDGDNGGQPRSPRTSRPTPPAPTRRCVSPPTWILSKTARSISIVWPAKSRESKSAASPTWNIFTISPASSRLHPGTIPLAAGEMP